VPRLRTSRPADPGITRVKHGRGFRYLAPDGRPLDDATTLARIEQLVIPPAWQEVWICPWPTGHIQVLGTDVAGRRQYRYHETWTAQRAQAKFDRVLDFAEALPAARARVLGDLDGRGMTRRRALATAVRLLDLGFFRVGSEESAEGFEHFGLTTLRRDHVHVSGDRVIFDYVGKSGKEQHVAVGDPLVMRAVRYLKRRDDADEGLLAWRDRRGWHRLDAADINEELRTLTGGSFTAKDFRTWSATVLCAVALAVSDPSRLSASGRQRAIVRAVKETSGYLGNTPAVCRASYIHPLLLDLYADEVTVAASLGELGAGEPGDPAYQGAVEVAVLAMLREPRRRRATG
jgi:DNA topoisomerase-1